jgi:hypothetical protein
MNTNNLITYVGIDFSLNSTSICYIRPDKILWTSITSITDDKEVDKILKRTKRQKSNAYCDLLGVSNVELKFLPKYSSNDNYQESERNKIAYFVSIAKTIIDDIKAKSVGDVYVAFEGISFGSAGNSLIDISMATALSRSNVIDNFGKDKLFIFPPSQVKKFAGKGTLKKDGMYEALLLNDKVNNTDFVKAMNTFKHEWLMGVKVASPISDIVDSTWVALFLQNSVETKQ